MPTATKSPKPRQKVKTASGAIALQNPKSGPSRTGASGSPLDPVPADALVKPASISSSQALRVATWNRWRERLNPLRQLSVSRVVTLLEQYQRGEMAEPQWTFFFIEMTDEDLVALAERRTSALLELDWNAKPIPKNRRRKDFDQTLADEQVAAIGEWIDGIDNFEEALEHFEMGVFRGYAHCEKYHRADGEMYHLEVVDQWNMVRNLLRGPWRYNPEAFSTTFEQLSPDMDVVPEDFVIFKNDRPLDRLGLIKFARQNLSAKDWDAFIEIYGIPSGVIIMPPDVPKDKEAEYQKSAADIAQGGSGSLPNGSEYKPNSQPRGTNPFKERLDFLSEKMILAGTGGQLTMLSQPTGIGSGASEQHEEAFRKIARKDAQKISGIIQRQFINAKLEEQFPTQQRLAYFQIEPTEDIDPGDVADHVSKFAIAGFRADVEQVSEKTGYKLVLAPIERVDVREQGQIDPSQEAKIDPGLPKGSPARQSLAPPLPGAGRNGSVMNRAEAEEDLNRFLGPLQKQFLETFAGDLAPLRTAIEDAVGPNNTETVQRSNLRVLQNRLPEVLRGLSQTGGFKSVEKLAEIIATEMAEGMKAE
jgi:phage gp29-like protein